MSLITLQNFSEGKWITPAAPSDILYNAITGEALYHAGSGGLDFDAMMQYARKVGNKNLRKMTFQERGRMLKALAMHLMSKKEDFYKISALTGATRIDSWVDIEGGIGNLFAYASLRRQFPDECYYVEGSVAKL
jgi:oxepin-CoA hydrolase/3-oxo-5,6-dehydrosuberyl-CoA semialdehyde dehydrogenase